MSRWLYLALGFLAGFVAAYVFMLRTMFLPAALDQVGAAGTPVCFKIGTKRIGCIRVEGGEVEAGTYRQEKLGRESHPGPGPAGAAAR